MKYFQKFFIAVNLYIDIDDNNKLIDMKSKSSIINAMLILQIKDEQVF